MNKYGIGFFTTAVLAVLILTFAYQFSFQKAREHAQEEAEVKRETQTVPADANKKEGYYLIEEDGFLVVYASDRKTVYEYTDIACRRMSAMRSAMENISVPRQICTDFWKIIPAETIENEKI